MATDNTENSKKKTALILGATGLVGKELLKALLNDSRYSMVTCFLRRPLSAKSFEHHEDEIQPIVIDFDTMDDYASYFDVDHVYVCLGTTIKIAGSQEAFRKVDYDYAAKAAQLSADNGAKSFAWVSSVGANAKSGNFYLRVKGELEDAIFSMSGLAHKSCVQPSLLVGKRNDYRFGECIGIRIFSWLEPLMIGPLRKYRPIAATEVAKQMMSQQLW